MASRMSFGVELVFYETSTKLSLLAWSVKKLTMISFYKKLKSMISKKLLRQIRLYVVLSWLCSVLEAVTILQIGPVIETILQPSTLDASGSENTSSTDLVFLVLLSIVTLARIFILYLQANFSFRCGIEVQQAILSRVMTSPWSYKNNSTSDLISLAAVKSERLVRESVLQFLMIINAVFIVVSVIIGLVFTNASITLLAVGFIAGVYSLLIIFLGFGLKQLAKK